MYRAQELPLQDTDWQNRTESHILEQRYLYQPFRKISYLILNVKNLQARGHSTRAIGTSYVLYKGASLDSILAAADWSRKSTFVKYYLRDMSG